jgi:dTDP-4-amino-4,6-dideoxygalactose transaminase
VKVPFADLNIQHQQITKEINQATNNVIQKGDFILGEDVDLFEKEFAQFCNSRYALGVSSGTAALFLAVLSLGIGEGDEVIVPAFTYIATALAVSYSKAKPVFVDIEEDTYNINVKQLEKAITKSTRAIIPVHLYGQPANMPEILKLAKKYNLKVIEDAAQAHGAEIQIPEKNQNVWHRVGCLGDIGCFSFYPSKNLGALGDGGLISTSNEDVYKKLLMLRDYGRVSKYEHAIIGYNSRLDTMQAAILRIKLKTLDAYNQMRQEAAKVYNNLLNNLDGVVIPYSLSSVRHVYHVYAVQVVNRDKVLQRLRENDIGAIIHYPTPLHLQKAYENLNYKNGDFPVAEKVAKRILSLPMFPFISKEQIEYVVSVIKKAI